jgi:hypothetical protein
VRERERDREREREREMTYDLIKSKSLYLLKRYSSPADKPTGRAGLLRGKRKTKTDNLSP